MSLFTSISTLARLWGGKAVANDVFQLKTVVNVPANGVVFPHTFGKGSCKIGRLFLIVGPLPLLAVSLHSQLIGMRNYHLEYSKLKIGKPPSN